MRWPVVTLAVGFATSSLLVTFFVHQIGQFFFAVTRLGPTPKHVLALTALGACFLMNGERFRLATPMWKRQAPQRLFYMFGPIRGAFLWGLDTGLMVTTFRITSLTWATLSLCLLGLIPWWSGTAYAVGFIVPTTVAVLLIPPRSAPKFQEPTWLLGRISQYVGVVYMLAFVALASAAVALTQQIAG